MFVLHALWDDLVPGKLHIWAESSELSSITSTASNKGNEVQSARLHPFVLRSTEAIAEIMGGLVDSLRLSGSSGDTLTLRLPSSAKAPLPSPELLVERPTGREGKELRWWNIQTLALDPSMALDVLLALPMTLPYGIAFGSSLRFWAEVAKFALELTMRQSFFPTMQEVQRGRNTMGRAVWKVTLTADDTERIAFLARVTPPICWSFMPPGEKKASLLQDMVHHFLDQTVDAFVRSSLSSTSLLPANRNRRTSSRPIAEQWVQALAVGDPTVTGSKEELKAFAASLSGWSNQIQLAAPNAPFRTCFRLDPPDEENQEQTDDPQWHLSFHLQANDDRSLLVPAEQVWNERSGTLTFLKRKFENPQERLLTDLGKAGHLFPPLEESLKIARPQDVALNTEEAYTFLRQSAPLLEQSGFGVLVPPWWQ